MYCISCGCKIEDGASFCVRCGMPADTAIAAPVPTVKYTPSDSFGAVSVNASGFTPNHASVGTDSFGGFPVSSALEKKTKLKTPILILAITALVFNSVATVVQIITFHYGFWGLLFSFLPFVSSSLFVFFCAKLKERNAALTGIPMLVYIFRSLFGNISIILLLFVLFITFYFLAVTNKFRRAKTGRILTIIFGGLITIWRILSYTFEFGHVYYNYSVLLYFYSFFNFFAEILLIVAMILCVFSVSKDRPVAPPANAAQGYYPTQFFCPRCGIRFPAGKRFCDQCGAELLQVLQPDPQYTYNGQPSYGVDPSDAPSGGFAALGFFVPVVGLILYLVWRERLPRRARSAGKGALAGVITSVLLTILIYAIYFIFIWRTFSIFY